MDPKPKDVPEELWAAEQAFIHLRRTGEQVPFESSKGQEVDGLATDNVVGLALSGGGIRSATISLGVLQALAKRGRLRFIDYLSTVSGGGYTGTFIGGLFVRNHELSGPPADQVPPPQNWERVEGVLKSSKSAPLDWLRENGRFLAPNGAGDLALAFAVMARNMVAVQLVIAVLFLLVLLLMLALRFAATYVFWASGQAGGSGFLADVNRQAQDLLVSEHFWLSPIVFAPLLTFVLWVLPTGVAYWLLPSDERIGKDEGVATEQGADSSKSLKPAGKPQHDSPPAWVVIAFLISAGLAASIAAVRERVLHPHDDVIVPVLLAFALLLVALLSALWRKLAIIPRGSATKVSGFEARNWMTTALRSALLVTLTLLVLAGIDSLGQTIHVVLGEKDGVLGWITGGMSSFALLGTWAQRIAGAFGDRTQKRLQLPVELLANIAGVGLLLAILVGLAAFAHDMTWQKPNDPRSQDPGPVAYVAYGVTPAGSGAVAVVQASASSPHCHDAAGKPVLCVPHRVDPMRYGITLGCVLLLTLIFRRTYSFVNRSSLAALYGARLARSYIGASNPLRRNPENQAFTRLLPGDDLELRAYQPHAHGGPLPIINVTLNETIAGRSQVEQRDRKGMNMAIGPAGVSVGVRHHAAWAPANPWPVPGELRPTADPIAGFRVFPARTTVKPLWPTVGRWTAISGAAVSTGLGARTSLGLSLVIGLLNFRLGHWFRSGIDPVRREQDELVKAEARKSEQQKSDDKTQLKPHAAPATARMARWLSRALPVQTHLLNELFARFPGTSSDDWYLTDGGHFENSAAYELIRRRLPFMIVCDNGADVERSFDDLGGLVRKARLDFGAQIRFLERKDLAAGQYPKVIGSLADLGFCGLLEETLTLPAHAALKDADDRPRVTRYATLASVTYDDEPRDEHGKPKHQRWLLILRPAVLGGEPLDVLNYQVSNPDFPQQSTGDQFFDEAQWEAYRQLGEHMATQVLAGFDPDMEKVPSDPRDGWIPIARAASDPQS
jgi:hypothetical protein